MAQKCAVPGCVAPAKVRGLCKTHYTYSRTTKPELTKYLAPSKTTGRGAPPPKIGAADDAGPRPPRRTKGPTPWSFKPEEGGDGLVTLTVERAVALRWLKRSHQDVRDAALALSSGGDIWAVYDAVHASQVIAEALGLRDHAAARRLLEPESPAPAAARDDAPRAPAEAAGG